MKLRRVKIGSGPIVQALLPHGWVNVKDCIAPSRLPDGTGDRLASDVVALLGAPAELRASIVKATQNIAACTDAAEILLPFEPRSFRDFMLYEDHAIAAARGFVRKEMPFASPIVSAYEKVTKRTFPKLRPHRLWYRQPIYYMGNHLTFSTDGDEIAAPSFSRSLDYELELGFVLAQPLLDASPENAETAIGGFVVLNDFSARDVQRAEMASGFGPQKSKHGRSAMSSVVVTADEILPRWKSLRGFVRINGGLVTETMTVGARWSLGEVLAHASRGEALQAGELFGTGTLPGGSGIETGHDLKSGDTIEIGIDGIATLSNRIV